MPQSPHKHKTYSSVVEAFAASVGLYRDRVAVACGDQSLTYNQLHLRSNALAAELRLLDVEPGDLVGVCSERRVELAVALLGILKAGAAYVPFDESYPESRLREMAEDAGIKVLLGENDAFQELDIERVKFNNFPKSKKFRGGVDVDRDSPAYVMFTSGSTGRAKGVVVPHRGILRLVINQNYCELGPDERILQHSPVAFDASTFEIWGALLNGGQLVIHSDSATSLRAVGDAIRKYEISTIWLTAGLFHAMVDERPDDLAPLKQLLTGGDIVSPAHASKILEKQPGLYLINGYGPTENTTFTCCHRITRGEGPIPIGTPISGTEVQIIDGELWASGDGLALGYLNAPELTAEKFVELEDGTRVYKTGDLAAWNEDGTVEFLGRIDHQVKIRGFRIEPGEIESAILDLQGVQQVIVVAESAGDSADKTLIAHYVADREISRNDLAGKLPNHCIPAFYDLVEELPLNPNGKVDRKALRSIADLTGSDHLDTPVAKPVRAILVKAFSEVLELPNIPGSVNFFDLGASSLQIARVHEKVQSALDREFPITDCFRFTTVNALADHLDGFGKESNRGENPEVTKESTNDFIAIVGLAGRFPGAPDVDTFWENLVEGRETISHFTAEELDFENATASGADPEAKYVRSRGIIEDAEYFDARHFGIQPREAEELDPQHRLMLECAQTALENAGHDPDRFDGKIGVFCGSSQNSYLLNNLCQNREYSRKLAAGYPTNHFNAILGNDKDFLPTRIAYKLNLKGPAVSVQCACSTSLVSVAQACESLLFGTCDMALAGGISLGHPRKRDYLYTPDGITSSDGHCRTFDEKATGTVFGEGAGLVALRRLDDAIEDGDNIVAVIRGFALNNDGSDKAGYTAPSINGQVDVIREAQKSANVEAETIGYIEAHGTGTPLGDPIEIAALNAAFRESTDKKHFCVIGTGKTNVGHLDIAAGIAGLIKTALTVKHGKIPPLLHFKKPNPKIDFDNSPFVPATELTDWQPEQHPRRAGVSAFGVGGTNVHMILEEAPTVPCTLPECTGYSGSMFPLSASHPDALAEAVENLRKYAQTNPGAELDSLAFTLQKGRRDFACRTVLIAKSVAELASATVKTTTAGNYSEVAFMFPGQGSQHPGMAQDLYSKESVFRDALDQCADIIREIIDVDLLGVLFPDGAESAEMAECLKHTDLAQPAIFSIEYALAQQWKHWGVTPACMIGHSIGEFAAACIAGVFTLSDALKLICLRGKLMAGLPGGTMISVRASEDEIAPFLTDEINLAAVNGAASCVIAGPDEAADEVENSLAASGFSAKRLHTSHAFHSAMMDSIVDRFEEEVSNVKLNPPSVPILSTVTGKWMTSESATDPHYWASHLRKPVRFHEAIQQVWKFSDHLLLEVGPGRTLATLASQNPDRKNAQPSLASLPHPAKMESAHHHIRSTLGQMWCHGLGIDWDLAEQRTVNPGRIPLPTYPFQRKRFWIEPQPETPQPPAMVPQLPQFPSLPVPDNSQQTMTQPAITASPGVEAMLKDVLAELSGLDSSELESSASFLELGFDSLLLTQVGKGIYDTFKVKVSLRELIDEFSSVSELSTHLEANFDMPAAPAPAVQQTPVPQQLMQPKYPMFPAQGMPVPGMPPNMQMVYLPVMMPMGVQPGVPPMPQAQPEPVIAEKAAPTASVSGPTTVIDRNKPGNELTRQQKAHIDQFVFRYTEKTRQSKKLTQKYRKVHADPRTASGFNRAWKEMVYQIVTTKSKGSRLLDVDGNEYIDILNGFGPGFLGHSADFLVEAVEKQLHDGYEVGPQSLVAMEAAELFCEVTGNERTSFVCTGSEAVQAAMRLARTVTRRDKIVIFARDYHGNFDEVLVRGVKSGTSIKSFPTAPGIPKASTGNMIVLPYGTDESLDIIRKMAHELAAVIIEPVQSRRPEFRPRSFIREVREITAQSGTLFVFDEVVTGFRFGPRGAQEYYGVEADLCTYGKVIGGGMPLGVVSGKAEYMDTFDGGMWQYGDDSFPEQPVTFFAGTFVRHPLAMASVKAMLEFFKSQPLHFWNQVNAKGDKLAGTVDEFFKENDIPIEMPNCGSLMFVRMGEGQKYGNLFFYHLREKGVFLLEGFPSYMTAAHSDEDIDYTIAAFKESTYEMQSAGFFTKTKACEGFDGPTLFGPPGILSIEANRDRESSLPVGNAKKFLAPLNVPTTEPQREILVASRLDERASCAFNESASLKFKGNLDVSALEKAFASLVARHDALRATFSEDGLAMTVHPEMELQIERSDFVGKDEEYLKAMLHVDASTPYNLEDGPLVRPMLIQMSPEEYHFVISAHHLVCDGWSYNVIAEELCELYNAECQNRVAKLALPKQYADHAREQDEAQTGETHKRQEAYWLKEFATIPEPVELPLDRPYPLTRTYQGATLEYRIDRKTCDAIKKTGAKHGSTLYSTLVAVFQLLIHRLTGQDDIVVCIPAAGQNDSENTENLIGHCVNLLPLRSRYNSESDFTEFLAGSRQTLLAATDNRSLTYGELIRKLDLERDPRRLPLLEVAFNVERMDYFGEWENLDVVFEPNGKTHVHYTMFMNIVESKDGLRMDVDYNTDVLDEDTVRGWLECFETLLGSIVEEPAHCVARLPIMTREQVTKVVHLWNKHETGPFPEKSVHQLFEEQVAQTPDATALIGEDLEITYRELNLQANSVAAKLLKSGVTPGDFVAVMANRSPEIVAGLLGILKVGAAYLPVDPGYPEDRVNYMLEDAAPVVLLKGEGISYARAEGVKILNLEKAVKSTASDDLSSFAGRSDDLAYVIYTSGSTGNPKGVLIPHRGIVRLVRNTNYMDFGRDQTFLLSAPISFDASTLELWGPLLNGGRLALLPAGTPGLVDIETAIEKLGVTTLWLTAGLFALMVDEHPEAFKNLKQLLAGGDVLPKEQVEKALKILGNRGRLINGYGPTENTTFTTCHTVSPDDLERASIPIGKPVAHTGCYILDDSLQPVPCGVKGRLYIGGDGLALGYLNQPKLTLKKFIPTPLNEYGDERIYDSGDECRWLKDGTIEFVGRADRQFKLRGFRIEPGEIENALSKFPGINQSVVRVTGTDATDKKLIGYVVSSQASPPKEAEMKEFLSGSMPAYMVPSDITVLSELPVTPNGKVDYKALPLPSSTCNQKTGSSDAPQTPTEKILSGMWREVLDCGEIGINEDFFKIGGHSLAGLKLFTKIHQQFGTNLPLGTLFQAPTIASLAAVIGNDTVRPGTKVISRVSKGEPGEVPLFLIHGGNGGTLFYKHFIDQIEPYRDIYTIESPLTVDRTIEKVGNSIEEIADLYITHIEAVLADNRLAIGGYSFGGVLAFEMAKALRSRGVEVERLFLFDTNNPANEDQFKNGLARWIQTGWEQMEGDTVMSRLSKSRERITAKLIDRKSLIQVKSIRDTTDIDDQLRMTLITEMHNQLMRCYTPSLYEGETFLFRAKASRYNFNREMGWQDLIPNLKVTDIEGRHQEIFNPPNVEVLIEKFNELFSLYA